MHKLLRGCLHNWLDCWEHYGTEFCCMTAGVEIVEVETFPCASRTIKANLFQRHYVSICFNQTSGVNFSSSVSPVGMTARRKTSLEDVATKSTAENNDGDWGFCCQDSQVVFIDSVSNKKEQSSICNQQLWIRTVYRWHQSYVTWGQLPNSSVGEGGATSWINPD